MPKHTPATPLPWRAVKRANQSVASEYLDFGDGHIDLSRWPGRADYIVSLLADRAKLVAALRKAMNQIDALNGSEGEFAALAKLPDARTTEAYQSNRALLRELGEE